MKKKETPIIFSTPMVQAILEGGKTMTRRVVKCAPYSGSEEELPTQYIDGNITCPYGQVGDKLWVRETFAVIRDDLFGGTRHQQYKADRPYDKYPGDWPEDEAKGNPDAPKWKPSIHMPKKYARIWLEITDVRVERLQSIENLDALAEGMHIDWSVENNPIKQFQKLWDSINGKKHPWESNPWVWIIEFKKC
jgi:hypothetical protein